MHHITLEPVNNVIVIPNGGLMGRVGGIHPRLRRKGTLDS